MSQADKINSFLLAFERMKLCCDGDPRFLVEDILVDDDLGSLCVEVCSTFSELYPSLNSVRAGILDNIAPAQLSRLREYADRWERVVQSAMHAWHHKKNAEFLSDPELDPAWQDILRRGDELAGTLEQMNAAMEADAWSWMDGVSRDLQADIAEELEETGAFSDDGMYDTAIGRFFWTLEQQEWDVAGIIRRAALVPDVMVPTHIARKLHNQSKPFLYEQLHQTAQAFVVGSLSGSIALIRALLEHVLSDLYAAEGRDLCEMINGARNLPPTVRKSDLHDLRKAANSMLHSTARDSREEAGNDVSAREGKVVRYLKSLRDLVEAAPGWPGSR